MAGQHPQMRKLAVASAFLAPNIVGVLLFTVLPVLFSVVLAFSNWDLRLHNRFKDEPLWFVGLDNFLQLFAEADFTRYLGNTLFLMMGIPVAVAGSLFAAVLLSKDARGGGGRVYSWLLGAGGLLAGCAMLAVLNMGLSGMVVLLAGLACAVLLGGLLGGTTVYRTLFYAPYFTAGVATFLLWKKLFNPLTGPINTALRPVLDGVSHAVNGTPAPVVRSGLWVGFVLIAAFIALGFSRLRRSWADGEAGTRAVLVTAALLLVPCAVATQWSYTRGEAWLLLLLVGVVVVWQAVLMFKEGRSFTCAASESIGGTMTLGLLLMTCEFVLLGLGALCLNLPTMAQDGLEPPQWLADYHWAKPALMVMAFWGAIGSNNMLLYLAALTNVPPELHEAADIDGAGRLQRFWHVTWPQLAPTTFFIIVTSTIGGLQGGFEMARSMTQGGPDGSTTTLSYFIYTEGFETGRLGYAAAASWALFLLVLLITIVNWRFGNRYVND